ncbi:MAG TPA: SET domain-containing protein [Pseudomonadales bacterium]|nr:SET domain-containing protein [Pseudomonadales bacterium]
MIHPDTEIRQVSPQIGCGVFAKKFLPMGTIIYIRDPLEIVLDTQQLATFDPEYRELISRYCYVDKAGSWVLSWDHSKYVNHSCNCNTMLTAYGFEIAVRDIQAGEEITDEYGLFNIADEIDIACGCDTCRKKLLPTDIDTFHTQWDKKIELAMRVIESVNQPLRHFMDEDTRAELREYLCGKAEYRSVMHLKKY